jgi:hypothetical protein
MNELTDRVQKLEAELAQLKNSGAYLVGTALLAIAKDPRRSLVAIKNLVRLWRLRHESDDRQFSTELGEPMLQRIRRATKFNYGPRVAVVGSDELIDALNSDCYVLPLMPHDRDVADVLLPFRPEIVVIEGAAGRTSTVWQHLGNPLAPDRSVQLARIVMTAIQHDIPVVLWANAPTQTWQHALVDLKINQVFTGHELTVDELKSVIHHD